MNLDSGRPIATGVRWTRVPVDFQLMLERMHGAVRRWGRGPGAPEPYMALWSRRRSRWATSGAGVVVDGGAAAPMTIRVTHVYRREDRDWQLVHRHGDFAPTDESAGQVGRGRGWGARPADRAR